MNHQAIQGELADYCFGRLDPERTRQVQEHLESCGTCRDACTTMRLLQETARSNSHLMDDEHPDADSLARYAEPDPTLTGEALARLTAHVAGCPTCSTEVHLARTTLAAARDAEEPDARESGSVVVPLRPWRRAATREKWAWAAVALLMLIPVSQLFLRGDAPNPDAGGGLPLTYLQGADRGSTSPTPVVEVSSERSTHPFIIECDLVELLGGDLSVEVQVQLQSDSGTAWETSDVARALWNEAVQSVALEIPTRVLRPGEYQLVLQSEAGLLYRGALRVADGSAIGH